MGFRQHENQEAERDEKEMIRFFKFIFKVSYYAFACAAFIIVINDVLILRWHKWDRHLLDLIPFGQITGWLEILALGIMAFASIYFIAKEIKKIETIKVRTIK